MWFVWYDNNLLEKKIERNIKESYSLWEKIRCYNLLKLMVKVNKDNKVLLHYIYKFDNKKLQKYYNKWARQNNNAWFTLNRLFLSPRLYISLILLYLFWYFR